VKEYVYGTSVGDTATLHTRIIKETYKCGRMLAHTWTELNYHLDVNTATRGFKVEMD
jgi:hypothetical protein